MTRGESGRFRLPDAAKSGGHGKEDGDRNGVSVRMAEHVSKQARRSPQVSQTVPASSCGHRGGSTQHAPDMADDHAPAFGRSLAQKAHWAGHAASRPSRRHRRAAFDRGPHTIPAIQTFLDIARLAHCGSARLTPDRPSIARCSHDRTRRALVRKTRVTSSTQDAAKTAIAMIGGGFNDGSFPDDGQ